MAEQSIRFAVGDGSSKRAATWKCWAPAKGKSDVYLACRALGGALKASLHESGRWHVAFSEKFLEANLDLPLSKTDGRFIQKWPRPAELVVGVTLAYRIVTPASSVTVPLEEGSLINLYWIPIPPLGLAVEVDVIITAPGIQASPWPCQRSMKTELVGSMLLTSGETVWIVYHCIAMPDLRAFQGRSTYFRGASIEDLSGPNLRALGFGSEPDGSRTIYDCVVSG